MDREGIQEEWTEREVRLKQKEVFGIQRAQVAKRVRLNYRFVDDIKKRHDREGSEVETERGVRNPEGSSS